MQNYHHVIMGLYKPEIRVCQMWPFALKQCVPRKYYHALSDDEVWDVIVITMYEMFCLQVDIMDRTRNREVVKWRQIAMHLLRMFTKMSEADIGKHFGYDRTTVIHSLQKVKDLRTSYPDYSHELTQLETKIKYRL